MDRKVQHKDPVTYVVLGNPRGGTSAVAGLLRIFNIFMGEKIDEWSHEDLDFVYSRGSKLHNLIKERNCDYTEWGFKDPTTIDHIKEIKPLLRNPHWIVVLRDPRDVAMSENRYTNKPISTALQNASRRYAKLNAFIDDVEDPMFVIDYNRLMDNTHIVIDRLAEYIGCKPTKEQLLQAYRFIGNKGYSNLSGVRYYAD